MFLKKAEKEFIEKTFYVNSNRLSEEELKLVRKSWPYACYKLGEAVRELKKSIFK